MNAYFQLMADGDVTKLRLVPPTDGGAQLQLSDVIDYLNFHKINFEIPPLNEAVRDLDTEKVVTLCNEKLIPVNEELVITISSDKMSATGVFYCASTGGQLMTKEEIMSDLKFKGVKFGIDESAIDNFLNNKVYLEPVVLARGEEPVQGSSAKITYYFNTDNRAKPTLNEDGSVDFFNLNIINHVNEGDILAHLDREVKGTPGTDVVGGKVNPAKVVHRSLKYGRNISVNEDKTEIFSMCNGHVSLIGGSVFVSDVMEVENVDISTGNIEYEGNVQVNGNVCSNFSVKAKGNVEVKGVVEGATVEAGGNITIARGMNGMGKGILRSGGNVIAKFIENSSVEAEGYVESGSIMHSNVVAGTEINTSGRKAFISGGKCIATSKVETRVLGSDMGADTVVEIGVSAIVKKKFKELGEEVAQIDKTLERAVPIMEAAKEKIEGGIELSQEQLDNVRNIYQLAKLKAKERKEIEEERTRLSELMEVDKSAQVIVKDTVYPGTKITISEVSKIIKDPFAHCKFVKSQGDVKMMGL